METPLTLELGRYRNLVFGKVIARPDKLNTVIDDSSILIADTDNCKRVQAIKLGEFAEISGRDFYISQKKEDNIFYKKFASDKDAEMAVSDIVNLVTKYNNIDGVVHAHIVK